MKYYGSSTASGNIENVYNGNYTEFYDTSSGGNASINNSTGTTSFYNSSTAGSASINNQNGLTEFFDTSTAGLSVISNRDGPTRFYGSSNAGSAQITNLLGYNYGYLSFQGTSKAGSASISNQGGSTYFSESSSADSAFIANYGGSLIFDGNSTAGSSSIYSYSNQSTGLTGVSFRDASTAGTSFISNASGRLVQFEGTSSAGTSIINSSGSIFFHDNSSASNSKIISSGSLIFSDNSDAGRAAVTMNSGSVLSFADTNGLNGNHKISIGSLEGYGYVYLGSNQLTIGALNSNMSLSASIQELNSTKGSIVKIGDGNLYLGGQNSYSGGTQLLSGTLIIGSSTTLSNGKITAGSAGTGNITFGDGAQYLLIQNNSLTSIDNSHSYLAYVLDGFGKDDVIGINGNFGSTLPLTTTFDYINYSLTLTGSNNSVTIQFASDPALTNLSSFKILNTGYTAYVTRQNQPTEFAWGSGSNPNLDPRDLFKNILYSNFINNGDHSIGILERTDGTKIELHGNGLTITGNGLNPWNFSGVITSLSIKDKNGSVLYNLDDFIQPLSTFATNIVSSASNGTNVYTISYRTDPLASILSGDDSLSSQDTASHNYFGGSGNDHIIGGFGSDSSIYLGSHSDYDIKTGITSQGLIQYVVSDNRAAGDGIDTLVSIENLRFSDGGIALQPNGPILAFGTVTHDTHSPGGEVYALYDGLLGRAPDTAGLEYWADQFDHGALPRDLASAFLASTEGQARLGATDNTSFIQQLYQNTLHRSADSDGLNYWSGQLAHGTARVDVADNFVFSAEHVNNLQFVFDAGIFVPDAQISEVARIYYTMLNRAPDAAGLHYWADQIDHGKTPISIAQAFLGTPESQTAYGSLSNAAYVDALYVNALGRHADSGGQNYWTGQLNGGESRADLAVQLSQSPEAQSFHFNQIELGWHLA